MAKVVQALGMVRAIHTHTRVCVCMCMCACECVYVCVCVCVGGVGGGSEYMLQLLSGLVCPADY